MLGLSIIGRIAVVIALAAIGFVGFDLLTRKEQRRGERSGEREPLPDGVDPTTLRKRRPMTNKLMGAVLLASVAVLLIVLVPVF